MRVTNRRVRSSLVALCVLLAGCGDDGDDGSEGGLAGLVDPTTATTATTEVPPTTAPTTTTTTTPPRPISPSEAEAVMLTQADLPGFGAPTAVDFGDDGDFVTDPPACGEQWPEPPPADRYVEIATAFNAEGTYSSLTQRLGVYPDLDLRRMLADVNTAIEGPCSEPFGIRDEGWAEGTLRYRDLSSAPVGTEAFAYVIDMDVVQQGTAVLATTHVVTFRRDPFVVTVQVVTGEAADGSFAGPPVTMDEVIARAAVIDQRIVALLES